MHRTITIHAVVTLLALQCAQLDAAPIYPRAGWTAPLSEISHDVSGTVTIVDAVTLQVDDFTYDGGGPAVYFYLGADDTTPSFTSGLELMPLLTGTVYDGTGGPLLLQLPQGHTMDPYQAISVWCAAFDVNFGSGTFVPEPGMATLVCAGVFGLLRRSRLRPNEK